MKLIVLDFDKNISYVYNVSENTKKEDIENILKESGHRTDKCQWMLTKNDIIKK
jgi:hypothetical protein|tara:strand:+ start:13 stop:174 length:162 start_codon:yes stop_codon:yes gene_type:complete